MYLQEYYKQVFAYKNRKIIDINHSVEQYNKRIGKTLDIYINTIKKGIDKIISKYKDKTDNYIIVNQEYNFGIQIDWRPDFKEKDNINHAFTATTLGSNELKYYTHNDIEIFVEQLNKLEESAYKESMVRLKHINKDLKKLSYDRFIENNVLYNTYEIIKI